MPENNPLIGALAKAKLSATIDKGDPAQSRLMLVKMSREAVSFALNALDDFETDGGAPHD